jgi:hypothetical protein
VLVPVEVAAVELVPVVALAVPEAQVLRSQPAELVFAQPFWLYKPATILMRIR